MLSCMDMVPTKCQSSDTINDFTKSVMMTILIQIGEESWTDFFMCLKYSNTNWTPQSTRSCHLQMEKLGTKEFTNLDSCEYDFCQMTFKPRFCYQMSMAVVYQDSFLINFPLTIISSPCDSFLKSFQNFGIAR